MIHETNVAACRPMSCHAMPELTKARVLYPTGARVLAKVPEPSQRTLRHRGGPDGTLAVCAAPNSNRSRARTAVSRTAQVCSKQTYSESRPFLCSCPRSPHSTPPPRRRQRRPCLRRQKKQTLCSQHDAVLTGCCT